MPKSDARAQRTLLLDAIKNIDEVALTLDGRERTCAGCNKMHYLHLSEGRARGTLLSAITRIRKGAREAGIDLEKQ